MSMLQEAVQAIRSVVEKRQAELDAAALTARANNIACLRRAATDGVTDPAALAVCALVAHTITVGRDSDNYPNVHIPRETIAVVQAAQAAGIVTCKIGKLELYDDASGVKNYGGDWWDDDYDAWTAAKTYRAKQTVQSL